MGNAPCKLCQTNVLIPIPCLSRTGYSLTARKSHWRGGHLFLNAAGNSKDREVLLKSGIRKNP